MNIAAPATYKTRVKRLIFLINERITNLFFEIDEIFDGIINRQNNRYYSKDEGKNGEIVKTQPFVQIMSANDPRPDDKNHLEGQRRILGIII